MPICKHCNNLGLPDANTHWLREGRGINSKIVCPKLLNTQCKFCKEYGHTISYCNKLKSKDNEKISNAVIIYNNSDQFKLSNNIFDNLNSDFQDTDIQDMDID